MGSWRPNPGAMNLEDPMATQQLEVRITSVYGTPTCYPVNEQAKLFAEVAGTKTLTVRTLRLALDLGFSVREERGGDAVEEFIQASLRAGARR